MDGGNTWKSCYSGECTGSLRRIFRSKSNPDHIFTIGLAYEGTSTVMALHKSLDSGATWSINKILSTPSVGYAVAVHKTDENIIYAGGVKDNKAVLFKSQDGGLKWTDVIGNISDDPIRDVAIDPRSPHVVYAVSPGNVYKTENSGQIWKKVLTSDSIYQIKINPNVPDEIYTSGKGCVFYSKDSGKSWTPLSSGLENYDVTCLEIDPLNKLLYGGTAGGSIYKYKQPAYVILNAPLLKVPANGASSQPSTITLRWKDMNTNPQEDKYQVRIKPAGSAYAYILVPRNATSYKITGLKSGKNYSWNVRALGNGKTTKNSGWANADKDWKFRTK